MIFQFRQSAKFKQEIMQWVEEDIITSSQAEVLFEKYELDKDAPWYFRTSFILTGLALSLVGLGLFLLISQNWEHFGIPLRMMFGLLPLSIAYFFGFRFLHQNKSDQSELAFFFGSFIFGLNIFLQAQIFHIEAYYPNGVLWWAIGTVPPAIYFRSNLHNFLLNTIYIIWLSMQIEHQNFSLWSVPIVAAIIYILYLKPNKLQLLITFTSFIFFLSNLATALYDHNEFSFFLFISLIPLLFISFIPYLTQQYNEGFLRVLYHAGAFTIIFMIYLLSFQDIADGYENSNPNILNYIILIIAVIIYGMSQKSAMTTWLFGFVAFITFVQITDVVASHEQEINHTWVTLVANISFLVYSGWLIWNGINRRIKFNFMLGVILILILAISRYLDYFEDYVFMSLMFIGGGGGIFLLNRIWNKQIVGDS